LGGFDCNNWIERDGEEHKKIGFDLCQCKTMDERNTMEKATGVRYSEVFRLPYFDPVRMHVVDPMHNLFLGNYFCRRRNSG